mmetsp:Transcript_30500/g.72422  ORF Transcript_30500/g.72422 Transcript_30500/m.72422 type:complete len:200 (+) Transcript_30500:475-1074(+)
MGEGEVGHVGPAPWPVDREETQAGHRYLVEAVVDVCDGLVGFLRGSVERVRTVDAVGLAEGRLRVGTVHGGGGGVDELHLREAAVRLEQRDETLEVIAHVRLRVGERVAHARLRREVRDVREPVLHEEAAEQLGVADVALQHLHTPLSQVRRARSLEGGGVVRVEVVDRDDPHAVALQPRRQVEADEASTASDQHAVRR